MKRWNFDWEAALMAFCVVGAVVAYVMLFSVVAQMYATAPEGLRP